MATNHRNWVSGLIVFCTVTHALETLRPGAEWSVNGSTLTWLDQTQTKPTAGEILNSIADCRSQEIQSLNDFYNLNLATNTAVQRLPALISILKFKGIIQSQ